MIQEVRQIVSALKKAFAAAGDADRALEAVKARAAVLEKEKADILAAVTAAADGSGDDAAAVRVGQLNSLLEIQGAAIKRAEACAAEARHVLENSGNAAQQRLLPLVQAVNKQARAARVDDLERLVTLWLCPGGGADKVELDFSPNFRRHADKYARELIGMVLRRSGKLRTGERELDFMARVQAGSGAASDPAFS